MLSLKVNMFTIQARPGENDAPAPGGGGVSQTGRPRLHHRPVTQYTYSVYTAPPALGPSVRPHAYQAPDMIARPANIVLLVNHSICHSVATLRLALAHGNEPGG